MQTKKSFKYWQWRVIICSMVGYSIFYFVRKNFFIRNAGPWG
jgi:Sugar phosphate permease